MPPEGSWKPNISLSSLLTSIHLLLRSPNLDDPIRPDLVPEWRPDNVIKVEALHEKENNFVNAGDQSTIPKIFSSSMSLSLSKIRKKTKLDPSHYE